MADHDLTPPTAALAPEEWRQQIAHAVEFSRTSGHGEIAAHIYVTLADVRDGGVEAIGDTEAVEIHWNTTERVAQIWDRHKLAALCLYQQPFGFTQSDVAILNLLADAHDVLALPGDHLIAAPPWWPEGVPATTAERAKALRSLALRIAALLPEEPR